ncbi:MAG: hypothetical protein O3C27_04635, partial [Actinomycetota bacterium]|nr:hypothetical protein [Actinomycetota bacterium]
SDPTLTNVTTEDSAAASPTDQLAEGYGGGTGQFGVVGTSNALGVDSSTFVEMVLVGMGQAIGAINLPVLVVERTGGRVLWASDAWLTRFGWQSHAARYVASSTELGESPLPAPGDTWQRTRSILLPDGAEDLTDLVLIGARWPNADTAEPDAAEIVTMVAIERASSSSVVTDRAEVMSIIDSAIEDANDGSVAVL